MHAAAAVLPYMRDALHVSLGFLPHARWDAVIGSNAPGAKETLDRLLQLDCYSPSRTVLAVVACVPLLHEMHAITPSQVLQMQLGIDLVRCLP